MKSAVTTSNSRTEEMEKNQSNTQQGPLGLQSTEPENVLVYTSYGKACLYCVKSKTRCVSDPNGKKCERCYRLQKDCLPASSVRKKRVAKRPSTSASAKTAALEQKIDSIVQILQRSQGAVPDTTQTQLPILTQDLGPRSTDNPASASSGVSNGGKPSRYGVNPHSNSYDERFYGGKSTVGASGKIAEPVLQHDVYSHRDLTYGQLTPTDSSAAFSTVPDTPDPSNDFPVESDAELEEALETYRTKMVPNFPIVCIRPDMTVYELKQQRPFLFLVIRAICSKNLRRQIALVLEVKKALGKEMLLEGAKTLDLFLGVLVFASWCHFYICSKPIISTVIQLGMSLAFDLGLTKPLLGEHIDIMRHYIIAHGCPRRINATNRVVTLEERRGVIGLYLVSSIAANYFQRNELMRWTPYLADCLSALETAKDYPTDLLLVYLVRVQLICNKGANSTWNDIFGDAATQVTTDFYVKTLKSQLDDLERSIPPELKSNVILQLHVITANLTIHEHSLMTTSKAPSSDLASQLERLQNLWTTFSAVKSWLALFFSVDDFPLTSYPYVSMAILTQLAHCLITLYRLTCFEAPGVSWDRRRVKRELDIKDVVQLMAERWEQVPRAAGIREGPLVVGEGGEQEEEGVDPWSYTTKRALGIGNWWEGKIDKLTAIVEAEGCPAGGAAETDCPVTGMTEQQQLETLEFDAENIDILDDPWMMDLLAVGYDFNMEPQLWQ